MLQTNVGTSWQTGCFEVLTLTAAGHQAVCMPSCRSLAMHMSPVAGPPSCAASATGGLPLRDSAAGGVETAGLATRRVESAGDALVLLRHGVATRATGGWRRLGVVQES